jgi:hypothetical protein
LTELQRLRKLKGNLDHQMKDWLRDVNELLGTHYVTTTGAQVELDVQIKKGLDYE